VKSFRIVITAAAKGHLREALEWMTANFASGRDVLQGELETALHRLALLPFSGSPFPDVEVPDIRRVLLRRSQYHVYYEVDEVQSMVVVHAVWSTARGSLPDLT